MLNKSKYSSLYYNSIKNTKRLLEKYNLVLLLQLNSKHFLSRSFDMRLYDSYIHYILLILLFHKTFNDGAMRSRKEKIKLQ